MNSLAGNHSTRSDLTGVITATGSTTGIVTQLNALQGGPLLSPNSLLVIQLPNVRDELI